MTKTNQPTNHQLRLTGKIIAPGIGIGSVHFEEPIQPRDAPGMIEPNARQSEIEVLKEAIELVKDNIEDHIRNAHAPADEDLKQVLRSHLMILDDELFFGSIRDRIDTQYLTAEHAVREAFGTAADRLASSRDLVLQARAHDLREVSQRLRKALLHGPRSLQRSSAFDQPVVFLTSNLALSSVMKARRSEAVGFVTVCEATTSKAAILLRASGIPAVGAVDLPENVLEEGIPIVVDGDNGEVVIWPESSTIEAAKTRSIRLAHRTEADTAPPLQVSTRDGTPVSLWGNIDHPSQTGLCLQHRLAGVGLFRTEFMALEHGRIPDESVQYKTYLDAIKSLEGRPLVIR